ncbi:hypothetical protein Lesp02_68260 [Lentzea sp. NBRC 105346]|uniref:hypothetical protein n=1 Tax=Lentzea sp. NBRC 105346 TaxID=3032205 RepID=UPI0024A0937E|nr:hypothetical protein [Lentzea sp. NBRC 105346]GLZ34639.1 hypothetical protein Lesp02_68260 [Lentzea sp. NBRC 105346]
MRVVLAIVIFAVTACGADVPAGLADKLKACPADIPIDQVATITKGLEVTEAKSDRDDRCVLVTSEGREVLDIWLMPAVEDVSNLHHLLDMLCDRGPKVDGPEHSCGKPDGDQVFTVHGAVGNRSVRIGVKNISITEEIRRAAFGILERMRD